MICAWESLLQILPDWMRAEVDKLGRNNLQELRLRKNADPELVLGDQIEYLHRTVSEGDLAYCIQAASRYSPWSADTVNQGYITAPGGHRLGICGMAVYKNGTFSGIRKISSVCIRIARDVPGIASSIEEKGSVLILGAPGWGKTTLLRDYIRKRAKNDTVAVVDERGELFPEGFARGTRMDVLTGSGKADGIVRVLRTMSPQCIAVDEITAQEDCAALSHAYGCGVKLIATAHAASLDEFYARPIYQPLARLQLFDSCLILRRDKSFRKERMRGC